MYVLLPICSPFVYDPCVALASGLLPHTHLLLSTRAAILFLCFVDDRVLVLGIIKPVATNALQPFPRTPSFNVEVVGPRVYPCQGEEKRVSALARVNALSTLKFGGAGELARTHSLFMNRLLYSQHRNREMHR